MLEKFIEAYQKVPVEEFPNQVNVENSLLTVRVTTYNHGAYLAECLDSVLEQETNFDFHILLMEDGSSDNTAVICKDYAIRYPDKIRLFLNSPANNFRIGGKRTGLFNSIYSNLIIKTPYIALIEGDDKWMDHNNLQKKIDILKKQPSFSFCFSEGVKFMEEENYEDGELMLGLKKSQTLDKTKVFSMAIPTASMVIRNVIEDIYHQEIFEIPNGDLLLRSKLLQYGDGYFLSEVKPVGRRVHNKGIFSSLTFDQKVDSMILTRMLIIEYFKTKGWDYDFIWRDLKRVYKKKVWKEIKEFRMTKKTLEVFLQHIIFNTKSSTTPVRNSKDQPKQ